jgi:polyvinyl alcohol dehydrogenase (cytochrome)
VLRLKLKWAFGFPNGNSACAQPSVYGGRVFVGSDTGFIYSLDAATGCAYWAYQAKAGVRTAVTFARAGSKSIAYFSDIKGNAYAVDAETGVAIWMARADTHPIAPVLGTPKFDRGRVYVPVASVYFRFTRTYRSWRLTWAALPALRTIQGIKCQRRFRDILSVTSVH